MKIIKYLLVIIALLSYDLTQAQCSDAGACSINSYIEHSQIHNSQFTIGFGYSLAGSGKSENNTYNMFRLNGNFDFNQSTSASFAIPFLSQSLADGKFKTSGFGDAIIALNNKLSDVYAIQIGSKIPLSLIDKNNFGYLNGYGTLDFMIGGSVKLSEFNIGIITQIPVTKYSDDNVEFSRGADLVLNIGYAKNFNKWILRAEGIAVKRLSESIITHKALYNSHSATIPNSNFFQFNLGAGVDYMIDENLTISFSTAIPVIKRDENSDGTKRAFTFQTGIKYTFN